MADSTPTAMPVAAPRPMVAHVLSISCGLAAVAMLRAMFHGSIMKGTTTTPARMHSR